MVNSTVSALVYPLHSDSSKRTNALALCQTLGSLFEHIPVTVRSQFEIVLKDLYSVALKVSSAEAALLGFEKSVVTHKWPAPLQGLKEPVVMLTKEYSTSTEVASSDSFKTKMQQDFLEYRKTQLNNMIELKREEIKWLKLNKLRSDAWIPKLSEITEEAFKKAKENVQWLEDESSPPKYPSWLEQGYKTTIEDMRYYGTRVIELARAKSQAELEQRFAKIQLKEKVDIEMTDAPETSISAIIDKKFNELLKKMSDKKPSTQKAPKSKPASSQKRKGMDSPTDPVKRLKTDNLCARSREEEGREIRERRGVIVRRTEEEEVKLQLSLRRRKGQQEKQGKEVDSMSFSFNQPSLFPDQILTLPYHMQRDILASRMPLVTLENRRKFRPSAHVQPGVIIPDTLLHDIGLNMRFLFGRQTDITLPRQAWEQFANSMRWKYHFFVSPPRNVAKYNPEFKLSKPDSEFTALVPQSVELGLEAGWAELFRQIKTEPTPKPVSGSFNSDMNKLGQYLISNQLLVKVTDKNLGPAIIRKEWYDEECLKLLNASNIQEIEWDRVPCRDIAKEIIDISSHPHFTDQEREFIRETTSDYQLPWFHGIPKIHKTPWAIRPIVPSHSWITSRGAKVASWYLKPCIEQRPWIAQSTRDVTRLLDEIRLPDTGRNIYICTGDVKAMYTNVPLEAAEKIIENDLSTLHPDLQYSPRKRKAIQKLIRAANQNNYFRFGDKFYHQVDGLAMGVACAPDIANIYAGSFEDIIPNRRPFRLQYKLYVRYIDDILVILEAGNEQEARHLLSRVNLGNLEVTWDISTTSQTYLDLDVFKLPGENRLRYKPFKKPLNSHLRIPWESAHPVALKRATFLSELSRLAINSSHREYYVDAVNEFREVLKARGWPTPVLRSWTKEHLNERWSQKLIPRESSPPLVIKSTYNGVWDTISIGNVQTAMFEKWMESSNLLLKSFVSSISDHRMVMSFRKGKSLGDLCNTWNASQVRSCEIAEAVETYDSIPDPIMQRAILASSITFKDRFGFNRPLANN